MGKTIRKSRVHTGHEPFGSQLLKVRQKIVSNKADVFMQTFHITEYSVDTVFPSKAGDHTAEAYFKRNIKNYEQIILRIKELITLLHDPLSDRPITNDFNWVLIAIEHRVDIDDDLVDTMSFEQKNILLHKLLEESEIRLIMLQSSAPVVLVSLVSSTKESENTMNANTTTPAVNKIKEVIEAAALNGAEHMQQAAAQTPDQFDQIINAAEAMKDKQTAKVATDTAKPFAEKVAEAVSGSTDKAAEATQQEALKPDAKPAAEVVKVGWKKVAKYAAATAAAVGAVAGGYWLYKNKFAGSISGAVSSVADTTSEQVVGG